MTALDRLLALPRFADAGAAAYTPGLDRMCALLAAMGNPERTVPALHVAGTNGKGSTASFAASIAQAAGVRVGLHTSPHLLHVGERMRIDGVPASDSWLDDAVERHADLFARVGPSFFEATTALAFLRFAEAGVDLAVIEVGLGGRLDATNVITPVVSLITSIGLDHTDLLGDTLAAIAREKAGIAKPGVPLLHSLPRTRSGAVAQNEAVASLEQTARDAGAPVEAVRETCRVEIESPVPLVIHLETPRADYGRVAVGLPGAHGAWNAALAVRACEIAVAGLTPAAVADGLRSVSARTGLRGRGEDAEPGIVLDVAHNDDGWRVALDVRAFAGNRRAAVRARRRDGGQRRRGACPAPRRGRRRRPARRPARRPRAGPRRPRRDAPRRGASRRATWPSFHDRLGE